MDDLLRFVQKASEGLIPRVEEDLGSGFVRLHISEAERRQAKHDIRSVETALIELMRNSRDAGSANIIIAVSKADDGNRRLIVIDDGIGIPPGFREAVFQSRITSRLKDLKEDSHGLHGRGMALFAIKLRAEECSIVSSGVGAGTVMTVTFDPRQVPEKTDQSTAPTLIRRGGELRLGRGPHNLKRVAAQFAIDEPGLSIYIGSPAEAVAAGCALSARRALEPPLFETGTPESSFWDPELHEMDAKSLIVHAAEKAGIELSLRNAQRIAAGELKPAACLLSETATRSEKKPPPRLEKLFQDEKLAARLGDDDLKAIAEAVRDSVRDELKRFYLEPAEPPRVRRSGSRLHLTLELRDSDEA